MEQHRKIIEFIGLPATGKTTLCENIKDSIPDCILFNDATKLYKNTHLFKKIFSINLKNIYIYLSIFCGIGFTKNRKISYYLNSIKIDIIYNFFEKYLNNKYLLVDHGIVQNNISIEGFDKVKNEKKLNLELAKILNKHSNINLIYIDEDINILINRITKRKRSVGRIDALINDNVKLKNAYKLQQIKFDRYKQCLSKLSNFYNLDKETDKMSLIYEIIKCNKKGCENSND